jgi:glycosyltransferase involved in cell wall biosynthesis
MRVVCWGTYDSGKPRNRILLRGLREAGVDLIEIHSDVWEGVEDKGDVAGAGRKARLLIRWLAAYPGLLWRYLRAPRHDAVVVGYIGQLDVLLLWPLAKLRGVPIVWDAFLSLYDTVVEDRRLIGRRTPLAWALYALECLACRAASLVVLDTREHADYFMTAYRLEPCKTRSVFVGAEPEAFPATQGKSDGKAPLTALFYGQFIPLHGIDTIVRAAQAAKDEPIHWILIGRGQEAARIRALINDSPAAIEWIEWVDYEKLREHIAGADICLGIFGDSDKAARVIPNKLFQILSAGAPLITRDSPAVRELLSPDAPGVYLVPPADPQALLAAIRRFRAERRRLPARPLHRQVAAGITPQALGREMKLLLQQAILGATPAAGEGGK